MLKIPYGFVEYKQPENIEAEDLLKPSLLSCRIYSLAHIYSRLSGIDIRMQMVTNLISTLFSTLIRY